MPYGTQTSIAPLVINPTSGAISGFTTGAGLTFHGGGTISGASGAVNVITAGTNTDFSVTPIGTGRVKFQFAATKASFGEISGASSLFLGATATTPTSANFALAVDSGNTYLNSQSASNAVFIQIGNATKVTVSATTGNLLLAAAYVGSSQSLSGPGSASILVETTEVTTTGVANAIALDDGIDGQIKRFIHEVDGGSFVLTPTTRYGWSTFTSTAAGESITLRFSTTRGWGVVGSYLGTIA